MTFYYTDTDSFVCILIMAEYSPYKTGYDPLQQIPKLNWSVLNLRLQDTMHQDDHGPVSFNPSDGFHAWHVASWSLFHQILKVDALPRLQQDFHPKPQRVTVVNRAENRFCLFFPGGYLFLKEAPWLGRKGGVRDWNLQGIGINMSNFNKGLISMPLHRECF